MDLTRVAPERPNGGLRATSFHADMRQAMEVVQLPSSQVQVLIYSYLGLLPEDIAARLQTRMENREFAIRVHGCAKEAIVVSALREMLNDPTEVEAYFDEIAANTADRDLADLRLGMLSMMLH